MNGNALVFELFPSQHPSIGVAAPMPDLRPRRQWVKPLACAALILATFGGILWARDVPADEAPRMGIVAACILKGQPNPEGLPVCGDSG